jgi:hypothetical protein
MMPGTQWVLLYPGTYIAQITSVQDGVEGVRRGSDVGNGIRAVVGLAEVSCTLSREDRPGNQLNALCACVA